MRNKREILCDAGFDEAVVFDGPDFDTAIIGVTPDGQVVYDFEKMITQLAEDDGITREEAIEFIEYNTHQVTAIRGKCTYHHAQHRRFAIKKEPTGSSFCYSQSCSFTSNPVPSLPMHQ